MTGLKTLIQEALNELEERGITCANPVTIIVEPADLFPLMLYSDEKDRHWTVLRRICEVFGYVAWVQACSYKGEAVITCVWTMKCGEAFPSEEIVAELRFNPGMEPSILRNLPEEYVDYFEILREYLKKIGLVKTAELIEYVLNQGQNIDGG